MQSGHTSTLGSCSTADCNPAISSSTNRISQSGYTFDANGSLSANSAGERFGYDQENHQKAYFTASNGGSTPDAAYSYDGEGRRIKKVSDTETTVFVYDAGSHVIAEYSTALASTQQVSYLTQDHLGSPRVITNENGAVTSRKDYAAFGDETTTAARVSGLGYTGSPDETRKNYTGYEKDSETGLEYAQARYYNPTHGRYTSIDPMTGSATIRDPQTFNRYSYVLNSPYKFVDPLGLLSQSTGACGGWCNNSDSSAFGGDGPMTAGGTETMFAKEFSAIVKSENDRDAAIAATVSNSLPKHQEPEIAQSPAAEPAPPQDDDPPDPNEVDKTFRNLVSIIDTAVKNNPTLIETINLNSYLTYDVLAVCHAAIESSLTPQITGLKGEKGLFQLKWWVAQAFAKDALGDQAAAGLKERDLYDPATNTKIATYYVKYLANKFGVSQLRAMGIFKLGERNYLNRNASFTSSTSNYVDAIRKCYKLSFWR